MRSSGERRVVPFLEGRSRFNGSGMVLHLLSSAVLAFALCRRELPAQAGLAPPVLSMCPAPLGAGARAFVPALVRRCARAFIRRLFGVGGVVPSVRGPSDAPVCTGGNRIYPQKRPFCCIY